MTSQSAPRRVATVSSATLLMCLFAAGTAAAATAPRADGSLTGPVTTPLTTTVTGAVSTVSGTVSTVASAVPVPAPTTTPAAVDVPAPVPTPTATPTDVGAVVSTVTSAVSGLTSTVTGAVTPVVQQVRSVAPSLPAPAPSTSGGALSGGSVDEHATPTRARAGAVSGDRAAGASHAVAATHVFHSSVSLGRRQVRDLASAAGPTQPGPAQLVAAGPAPALAPQPRTPFGPGDDSAPRGLFIALATMVVGALTAAHVKVAQDRLGAIYY